MNSVRQKGYTQTILGFIIFMAFMGFFLHRRAFVEFLIEALTSTDKQVLVTTHRPIILNYLSDEVAKSGVLYLYKTPTGITKAIQFFSIPSIAEKLTVMGPGEVFVDTSLTDLTEEIQSLDAEAR